MDISPLRRVNQAIYLLTTGAREAAFRNVKTIAECLADELVNAAKGSSNRSEVHLTSHHTLKSIVLFELGAVYEMFHKLAFFTFQSETRCLILIQITNRGK